MLAIEFATPPADPDVVVEALPGQQDKFTERLCSQEVQRQVQLGISDANQRLSINYRAAKIWFAATDTPPVEVYRTLASAIVLRLAAGDVFLET